MFKIVILWYKLNPRVRCAFGNVLLILCTSPGQGDSARTSTWTPRTRRDGALCTWLALEGEGRLSGCLSKRGLILPWLMAGMDSCRRTQIKMHTSSKSKSEDHQQFIMKCISQGIIYNGVQLVDWLKMNKITEEKVAGPPLIKGLKRKYENAE